MQATLEIKNLSKYFDQGKVKALNGISFSVSQGDICAVVGESGSGKTTLIRLIAGLEVLDYGEIFIKDKLVASIKKTIQPEKRDLGMVFQ